MSQEAALTAVEEDLVVVDTSPVDAGGYASVPVLLSDFGSLSPEINSGRIYAGPGSGPVLAAAGAWDALATELGATACGYSCVITQLTSLPWSGPAAAAMLTAVTPYVSWLTTMATRAEQTAMQARAAAAAYEAAFAMTVPPPAIAVNRVRLLALIATNFFGQNTPSIAATEAEYAEFWAQDATAMYCYASTSTSFLALPAFPGPPRTTDPAGLAGQAAATSQSAASATSSSAIQALTQVSSSLAAAGHWLPILSTAEWNTLVNTWGLAYFGAGIFQLGTLFAQQLLPDAAAAPSAAAASTAVAAQLAAPVAATPVSAVFARADTIGPMSVPPSWTTAAPAPTAGGAAISGIDVAPGRPQAPNALLPNLRDNSRATTFARRRYGIRLTVMLRPPEAG
ncbi:PPE family protein [Mycobacterium marinum]|uniref:PPE family protein n=1 Tax=Mycobacterium marinum TaxID=1781 RepID=UPI003FEDF199